MIFKRRARAATVICQRDPSSAAAEAYRVCRTNLQYMELNKPMKSILVTSAMPGEGKTSVAANLAVTIAQTGARVCLVDAHLRRPCIANLFGIDSATGLTTVLLGDAELQACLRPSEVRGLTVLPGVPVPPNPVELLGSSRMQQLLGELESDFDMVILDSAPLLGVADAHVLAPRVGGVILVTRADRVGYPAVIGATEVLAGVRANLMGAIVTGYNAHGGEAYYRYHSAKSADQGRKAE